MCGKTRYVKIIRPELVLTERELLVDPVQTPAKKNKKKSAPKEKKIVNNIISDYEGWDTHESCYLAGYTKDKDGKNCPVHKTWDEAVAKYKEMMDEGLMCGGITQTSKGFQCRKGSSVITTQVGDHAGLACYTQEWKKAKPITKEKKEKKEKKELEFIPESDDEETQEVPTTEPETELDVSVVTDKDGVEWYYDEASKTLYNPTTADEVEESYKVNLENSTIIFE